MAVICTILSQYLLTTDDYEDSSHHRRQLFTIGLSSITTIGATHPLEFKTVIANNAGLRAAVEESARLDQSLKAKAQEKADLAARAKQQQKPTIQLKMNFGNFK